MQEKGKLDKAKNALKRAKATKKDMIELALENYEDLKLKLINKYADFKGANMGLQHPDVQDKLSHIGVVRKQLKKLRASYEEKIAKAKEDVKKAKASDSDKVIDSDDTVQLEKDLQELEDEAINKNPC